MNMPEEFFNSMDRQKIPEHLKLLDDALRTIELPRPIPNIDLSFLKLHKQLEDYTDDEINTMVMQICIKK